jgi:RHS repeat-associated protein
MFWAPNGQKLAEYALTSYYGVDNDCDLGDPIFYATQTGTYYYFGGRMIKNQGGWVYPDRLGSIGKFYPYGTERPSATTNGTEKFTGYFRDAETGDDYAINRYGLPGQGRFMTPDPYRANTGGPGNAADPGSWNRYAYTRGDPVNRVDRHGRQDFSPDGPMECPDDCPRPDLPHCEFDPDDPTCQDVGGLGGGGGPGCGGDDLLSTLDCAPPEPPPPSPPPIVVTSVDITGDCWQLHNGMLLGAPSRDQTFTAFDGPTDLAGDNIVITEAVTTSPGGALATGIVLDPASSGSGGVFNDQKGLSANQRGTVTLYQSFTVSVNGGTPYAVPIVLANGTTVPYLTYTMSATYGSLLNWFRGTKNYNVTEYGQGKNQLPQCGN